MGSSPDLIRLAGLVWFFTADPAFFNSDDAEARVSEAQIKFVLEQFKLMEADWSEDTGLDQMRSDLETLSGKLSSPDPNKFVQVDAKGVACEYLRNGSSRKAPVVLYFHGGGYVVSSAKTHRDVAKHLAQESSADVLTVDYRLAPENPFPAALEDAESAYDWLLDEGNDPTRIIVSGDSAGGGLALALLLKLRDQKKPLPACAVLYSPWADLTCSGASYTDNAETSPVGNRDMGLGMAAQYMGEDGDPENPYASPVFGSYDGLPPLLIQVSDTEVFLDDSLTVERKAKEAKVNARVEQWPGVFHAWQIYASAINEGQEAIAKSALFIKDHVNG